MRRRVDLEPKSLFRGAELARLMTMLLMLAVLGMLMARAKDPRTWAMFAGPDKVQGLAGDEQAPANQVSKAMPEKVDEQPVAAAPAPAAATPETATTVPEAAAPGAGAPEASAAEAAEAEAAGPDAPTAKVAAAAGPENIAETPAQSDEAAPAESEAAPAETAEAEGEPAQDVPPPDYPDGVQPETSPEATSPGGGRSSSESRHHPADIPLTEVPLVPGPGGAMLPELPPLDEDTEERESLAEEMLVVVDKEYLQKVEMGAYYRLLRWAKSQTAAEMRKRAEKDVRFGEIFTRPDAYRGKLVDIRLHVRRALSHKNLEEGNPAGITKLWELVGYNDSSGQNFFMCVTPELPADMPVGEKISESGRFTGYFFKLMAYEDVKGIHRAIPVLVGNFTWDPPVLQKADPKQQEREILWGLFAGGLVGVVLLVRWGIRQWKPQPAHHLTGRGTELSLQAMRRRWSVSKQASYEDDAEGVDIETWLEQSEAEADPAEINLPPRHDSRRDD